MMRFFRNGFGKINKGLAQNLKSANMKKDSKKYLEESLMYSSLAGIGIWLVSGLLTFQIIESLATGLLCSLICFCFYLYLPIRKKKRAAKEFEKEFPFAMSAMAVEMNLKIPFEQSINNISKENYGLVSSEFKKVSNEINESGSSLSEALLHLTERIDSLMLKRAVAQISAIYSQGSKGKNSGDALKKISSEILSRQKTESKEFSGKLVVFSLMFVAVSAIVPAIFQAFIIVGSMFLKLSFNAIQVFLIVTLVFPLLDIAILIYIRNKTPIFMRD
ncbi:MAG: type II secretion system F family protein [Candidatus Diapherotrites archaeon]